MFAIAFLMVLAFAGLGLLLLSVGLVLGILKLVFRLALLPILLVGGIIKVVAVGLVGLVAVALLAAAAPVILAVVAVLAIPALAIGVCCALAWGGLRLVAAV